MKQAQEPISRWLKLYYIATYTIALIALFGVYMSIRSINTSKKVVDSLEAINMPLINFKDIKWINNKGGEINCENHPVGMAFSIENTSTVPIQIYENK